MVTWQPHKLYATGSSPVPASILFAMPLSRESGIGDCEEDCA